MKRWIEKAVWFLFAVVMYLILVEAVRPWFGLPTLGNIGFTLVLVLFALTHCVACEGLKRTGFFFVLTAVTSYLLEEIGVRSGAIYGLYHYGNLLGPKLGHVPILIPLAWFMMIYTSWVVARALLHGLDRTSIVGLATQALVAALVMTAWDTVMDPGMASAGNWVWEKGGAYFGVPLQNYFGWILTTFLVYVGAGLLWRGRRDSAKASKNFAALPIMVYAFYAVSYVVPKRVPALQIVALFAMGLPGLLACASVWMKKEDCTTASAQQ